MDLADRPSKTSSNYFEMFYNPVRRHGNNDDRSPIEPERRYFMKMGSVKLSRVDS